MNTIATIVGAPGVGKSKDMKKTIVETPGRYIFAAPRKELLDDTLKDLERLGYQGVVEVIYDGNSKGVSVDQCLTDFVQRHDRSPHAVALITHCAALDADLDQFGHWHLMLDEAPANAVMTGTLHARASLPAVKELFSLERDPQGRDGVMLLRSRPGNVHDLLDDPQMAGLANLWRRGRSCDVFIKCKPCLRPADQSKVDPSFIGPHAVSDRWADIAAKPCPYASVWSLDKLEPFRSVTIAAAGLEHSLVHLCNPQTYNAKVLPPHPHTGIIRVHCFDTQTQAGSSFFKTEQGRANLSLVAEFMRKNVNLGYWTCNKSTRDHLLPLMPAGYVSPLQEGSNRLFKARSCAAFYSAKVTPADRLVMDFYGITEQQILRARQYEHLAQFSMRGAPRCADFEGVYDIYVYDRWQAMDLHQYLTSVGFTVEVEHIDLEDMQAKAEPRIRGRKAYLTAEEAKDRKKQRDNDRYAKKKAVMQEAA